MPDPSPTGRRVSIFAGSDKDTDIPFQDGAVVATQNLEKSPGVKEEDDEVSDLMKAPTVRGNKFSRTVRAFTSDQDALGPPGSSLF